MRKKTVTGILWSVAAILLLTSCSTILMSASADSGAAEVALSSRLPPPQPSPEPANTVVEISFAGVTSTATKEASELWKEIVERETAGALSVKLYPDNMLGDDLVTIQTVRDGHLSMTISSTSPLCEMYPDFYLFDSPYLFLNKQQVFDVLDGEVGQKILSGLEADGLKGLMFWENGFRNFTNDLVPVSGPEDVAGMRVRTMENDVHKAAWSALGAVPVPMSFNLVYSALQRGEIDAQENALDIISSNKFHEVSQYVSLTQHIYTPYVVVMNLDQWNALTSSQQAAIERAGREATVYQRERAQQLENAILADYDRAGVQVISPQAEERSAFQQVIQEHQIFELIKEKMNHPEYLDQVLNQ